MAFTYRAAMPATSPMTVAQDVFALKANSTKPCLIRRCVIEQSSDTDSEQLRIIFSRYIPSGVAQAAPALGSGGAEIDPVALSKGAPIAAATVRRNDTTPASGGTQQVIEERGWNVLTGVDAVFDPPVEVSPGDIFVANLSTAPVDAITPAGFIEFDEQQ